MEAASPGPAPKITAIGVLMMICLVSVKCSRCKWEVGSRKWGSSKIPRLYGMASPNLRRRNDFSTALPTIKHHDNTLLAYAACVQLLDMRLLLSIGEQE
jgi:hypothetical protein